MDKIAVVKILGSLMALALAGATPAIQAEQKQAYGMGQMMWPGMMGPGMGYGYGPAQGYRYGMGMMGPGMMGPGMMGPGMMMGPGGYGPMGHFWGVELKDDQVDKINKIWEELFKKERGLMQQMWEQQSKLQELYLAEKRDSAAIGKTNTQITDLHRQALEARIDGSKRMEAVLTKEQKETAQRNWKRWRTMWQ